MLPIHHLLNKTKWDKGKIPKNLVWSYLVVHNLLILFYVVHNMAYRQELANQLNNSAGLFLYAPNPADSQQNQMGQKGKSNRAR